MKYFSLLVIFSGLSAHQRHYSISTTSSSELGARHPSDMQWSFKLDECSSEEEDAFTPHSPLPLPHAIPEEAEKGLAPTPVEKQMAENKSDQHLSTNLNAPASSLSTQASPAHTPRPRSLVEDTPAKVATRSYWWTCLCSKKYTK